MLTIKTECLDKMILFGERHIRFVVSEYVKFYNSERPHQGIGNRRIGQEDEPPTEGRVTCRQRLGGLLKSYYREAA